MQINHVLIRTKNLEVMSDFFVKIVGLEVGFRPPFSFEGAWLYSENKPCIHLSLMDETDEEQLKYLKRNASEGMGIIDHIAFQGADYDDLIRRLSTQGVHYSNREIPLTKERQVFIEGPEELIVEMLFDI
jgi:lactoylglutathione lyase